MSTAEEEIDQIIDALTRAFEDNVGMQSMCGGDKALESLVYRLTLQQAIQHGDCYVARNGDTICGVAAWLAPGFDWTIQRDNQFASKLSSDLEEWYRDHFTPKYDELYRSGFPGDPHMRQQSWSLKLLAVSPHCRRKGVGKALLDVISKKADTRRESIVVDVMDPYLVNFFQACGFKYRAVKNVSSTSFPGFPIWCMVRKSAGS
ncbi:unnamed protein product [Somion occarium]|uniref:N-acetyltransferase domain-containing protein n=1 Tax=Somion occarium TaxID=3059160 RepID=A0ABP1DSH0_9APHY